MYTCCIITLNQIFIHNVHVFMEIEATVVAVSAQTGEYKHCPTTSVRVFTYSPICNEVES